MTPVRDPIRNIVYSAQAEDLNSSIVDGEWIMRDRYIPNVDLRSSPPAFRKRPQRCGLERRTATGQADDRSAFARSFPSSSLEEKAQGPGHVGLAARVHGLFLEGIHAACRFRYAGSMTLAWDVCAAEPRAMRARTSVARRWARI